MAVADLEPIARFAVDSLQVHVYEDRALAGRAAAQAVALAIRERQQAVGQARIVFAAEPTDIVCAGIGENGHLAFNDPPVADFLDPVLVKVIRLDQACRTQQLHDGCFDDISEIPTHAYTLTIPALLRAPIVSVIVPGP